MAIYCKENELLHFVPNSLRKSLGLPIVKLVDELNICGCGDPRTVYKLIHVVMKEIRESRVKTDDKIGYYNYMIYQLNAQGFLEHETSIFESWVTEKGKKLIEALDEMAKYDYWF